MKTDHFSEHNFRSSVMIYDSNGLGEHRASVCITYVAHFNVLRAKSGRTSYAKPRIASIIGRMEYGTPSMSSTRNSRRM